MRKFLLTVSLSLLMILPSQTGFALGALGTRDCLRVASVIVLIGWAGGVVLTAVLVGVSTKKACDPNSAFNTSITVTADYSCKLCYSSRSPNCCNNENIAGCRGTLTYVDSVCPRTLVYCENENQTRIDAIDVRDWPSTRKYIGICLGMTAITAATIGLLIGSCMKRKSNTPEPLPDYRDKDL